MKLLRFTILTLFSFLIGFNSATAQMKSTQDWPGLESWLLTSPDLTFEQFLAQLPADYFRYNQFTYVTQSLSPEKNEVSAERPRVILFGQSADVIIAYEGQKPAHEKNEIARVIRATGGGKYEFLEIEFSSPLRIKPEKDNACFRCHEGKPIWGSYRDWRGTYAPFSDLQWVPKDIQGFDAFKSFAEKQKQNPRYARLIAGHSADDSVLGERDLIPERPDFTPRKPFAPASGDFLNALVPNKAKHSFQLLKASQLYPKLKFLLVSEFLGCPLATEIESALEQGLAPLFTQAERQKDRDVKDPFRQRMNRLLFIGRAIGVSPADWALEIDQKRQTLYHETIAFTLGGGVTMADFVFREMTKDLGQNHLDIKDVFSTPRWSRPYYSYLDARYHGRIPQPYPQNFDPECKVLTPYVQKEFAENQNRIEFLPNELKPEVSTTIAVQCQSCHNGSVKEAPTIQFNNHDYRLKWSTKIKTLISTGEMPKGRGLNEAQKAMLIRELESD